MPKLIDALKDVAPFISGALTAGGPYGVAASAVLNTVLGLSHDADPATQADAVANATPDQLLALKQADYNFQLQMKQMEIDSLKVDAEDRDSARKRDIAMAGDIVNRITMCSLAAFSLGIYMFVIWLIASRTLDGPARDLMLIIVGSTTALVTQVFNYYFGSSAGSANKDKMLATKG